MSIASTYATSEKNLPAMRLRSFLKDFSALRANSSLEAKLTEFLAQAEPLLQASARTEVNRASTKPKIDVARFVSILPELAGLLQKSRNRGEGLNPWSVAGLRHYEVRNVGVLASLWDPRLCGEQAIAFLDNFLRRISVDNCSLPTRKMLGERFWVRTEHSPISDGRSERIDLTFEGKDFLLIIEVKIYANESGPDQYQRYAETAEKWSHMHGGKPASFILLAPFKPAGFKHHHASWSDVAAAASECLPRFRTEYTFHSHLLENFVRHIAGF